MPPPTPPPALRFGGVIDHAPAARIRFGPGLDMPVIDLAPVGEQEIFDGWFRRSDEEALPDEITGRIEPWSRDWLHLADGRGWVHSASVNGNPPPGAPPAAWTRPPQLPAAAAGLMEIAIDRQDQNATCEVASLKMALAWRGVTATEEGLLAQTGIDRRPPEVDDHGTIRRWGNPDASFVGDPGGRAAAYTGYGVYAGPIARAARASGVEVAAAGTGVSPDAVYAAVVAGRPVVAWVTSDYGHAAIRTWTAWDGATVRYAFTEHAVLVIGVTPTRVLIDAPWWGQLWKSREEFEAASATFDGMAVVVA